MSFTIRPLTSEDVLPLRRVLAGATHTEFAEDQPERIEHCIEFDRTRGVFEGDELVGVAVVLSKEITVPGGVAVPAAGMTALGVMPGYQRQGALATLAGSLVETWRDQAGEPLAIMWASEGSLYGRYGCGELGTDQQVLAIPHAAPFHAGVDTGTAPVRERTREEALPTVKAMYDRVRRTRIGWLRRSDGAWDFHLADEPRFRDGMSSLRFALHPQGYAIYRLLHGFDPRSSLRSEVHVKEIVAETDVARAALYRHLLDLSLGGELRYYAATDDPIVHLLANPRLAVRTRADAVWVRITQVDQALELRHYQSDVDLVLDVDDPVVPWNAGHWRFTVKDGRATVVRTDDEADVTVAITALGSAYLGGVRFSALTGAQKVREHTPGAVAKLSLAFQADHDPYCPELF